jgi:iron complex outermembrane receptor protein
LVLAGVSFPALLVGAAGTAFAQDTPPAPPPAQPADASDRPDDIVVTGIRASIANALRTKRESLSIVESISAEDIGKLPNVSIADSLAQLPGLSVQRVAGRGQIISIRGFGPDFISTFLNGRQLASARYSRAVSFDQYPAELLTGVDVYKTPNLDLPGMGLAGTVNLKTLRPLSYSKPILAVNIRGEANSIGRLNSDVSNKGFRAEATFVDQFANDTLGFSIGYAHLDSPSFTEHTKNWYYGAIGNDPLHPTVPPIVSPASASGALFLQGLEARAYSRRLIRDGVTSTLEWRPSDKVHSTLDFMYSQFYQKETMRGIENFANPSAIANAYYTNVGTTQIGGTTVATSGTLNNWQPIINNQFNTEREWLFSVGNHTDIALSDRATIGLDVNYSRDHDKLNTIETFSGTGTGGSAPNNIQRVNDALSFDVPFDASDFPQYGLGLNYADASKTSLGDRGSSAWGGWGRDGTIEKPDVVDSVFAADLGGVYRINSGIFENFDFGVNYQHHKKTLVGDEFYAFLNNNRAEVSVDPQYLVAPTSLAFAGLGPILSYNVPGVLGNYYTVRENVGPNSYDRSWTLQEDFVTARFKLTLRKGRLSGDVGSQLVFTRQGSYGGGSFTVDSNLLPAGTTTNVLGGEQLRAQSSYVDFLPNLNLIYDLQEGAHPLKIRFSIGRAMVRPRTDDLRVNYTIGFGMCPNDPIKQTLPVGTRIYCWTGSGGNTRLKPWRATAVDLSVEKYFGPASYVAVAAFYKNLDSYIYKQAIAIDYSTRYTLPSNLNFNPPGATGPYYIDNGGTFSQPANGKAGHVWGIEAAASLELGRVVHALDGFGLQAAYSYTESTIQPNGPGSTGPLPGLSKNVYQLTAYFEKAGFQTRVNYHFRSSYTGEVDALFGAVSNTAILSDKQMDAQIGYTFQKGSPLAGLSFTGQLLNALNSPYRTVQHDGNGAATGGTANNTPLPEIYEKYGRTFLVGIGYKF